MKIIFNYLNIITFEFRLESPHTLWWLIQLFETWWRHELLFFKLEFIVCKAKVEGLITISPIFLFFFKSIWLSAYIKYSLRNTLRLLGRSLALFQVWFTAREKKTTFVRLIRIKSLLLSLSTNLLIKIFLKRSFRSLPLLLFDYRIQFALFYLFL